MSDQHNSNQNKQRRTNFKIRNEMRFLIFYLFYEMHLSNKYHSFERQNSGRRKFFIKLSEFLIKTACCAGLCCVL